MSSELTPLSVILDTKAEILQSRELNIPKAASLTSEEILEKYELLLSFSKSESCVDAIMELKQFILQYGIPNTDDRLLQRSQSNQSLSSPGYGSDSLRVKIWKLLLGVPLLYDVDHYIKSYEESGPGSPFETKIKDDAFRTFKVDENFWSRTNEETMIRVLKTLANDVGYVQGMNVLLGPFLYIMPELDAYYCCYTLCSEHIPSYIRKNLEGVHRGIGLAGNCLKLLDPQLHAYLISKLSDLRIFALRYILTLMANVQPLKEVIRLWDGLLALGVHFSVVIFCCYLINLREEILREPSSFKICNMIEKSSLDSELLLKMGMASMEFIPEDLFEELIDHLY